MKRVLALVLALAAVFALASCGAGEKEEAPEENVVMTYTEFAAAEIGADVVVEAYVQDKQSWWEDRATVSLQDADGGYFAFEMTCSREDYARLTPGTKIRVTGKKSAWPEQDGEIEIDSAAFEFVDGAAPFIAEAEDVSALLGTDALADRMNRLVVFRGMSVIAQPDGSAFAYKDADKKTDDLYFTAELNGVRIDFCVEFYLRGQDTDVYKAVEELKVGEEIDIQAYLYWYQGPYPHVIAVSPTVTPEPAETAAG